MHSCMHSWTTRIIFPNILPENRILKIIVYTLTLTRCYCIVMWRSNFWLHTTWYSMFLSYKFKSTSDACLQIHLKMLNVAQKSKTKSHFVFVLVCYWTYLNNGLLTLCFFHFFIILTVRLSVRKKLMLRRIFSYRLNFEVLKTKKRRMNGWYWILYYT